jgi:hypothetical protein
MKLDMSDKFAVKGEFVISCYSSDGLLKWEETSSNQVTASGIKNLLETYFAGSVQTTTWHVGLIKSINVLSESDTMSLHPGWVESTAYLNNRPIWTPAAVVSNCAANSPPAEFAINASSSVAGFFLTDNSAKGGSAGLLWSTSALNQTKMVSLGDSLRVVYQIKFVNA